MIVKEFADKINVNVNIGLLGTTEYIPAIIQPSLYSAVRPSVCHFGAHKPRTKGCRNFKFDGNILRRQCHIAHRTDGAPAPGRLRSESPRATKLEK